MKSKPNFKYECVLILSDVRSSYNVGAIFRTADAAGISRIYLAGLTPLPLDRFNRPSGSIAKTALGAEKAVPWESAKNTRSLVKKLKKSGFSIVALEQSQWSKDYKKVNLKKKTAIIVGSEVKGLSKSILKDADVVAEIPMRGEKESLNVSVALGIALFRILDI